MIQVKFDTDGDLDSYLSDVAAFASTDDMLIHRDRATVVIPTWLYTRYAPDFHSIAMDYGARISHVRKD